MAAKSLEELLRINPGDTKTLAQLVVAYAQVSMLIKLQRICPALTIMAHLHPSKTCGKNVLGIKCAVYFFLHLPCYIFKLYAQDFHKFDSDLFRSSLIITVRQMDR